MNAATFVVRAKRVVTCVATASDPLGVLQDHVIAIENGRIAHCGPEATLPEWCAPLLCHSAELVTPGLIDAHTHAAYMGSRHDEYLLRMAGEGYEAIAKAGGGIVASMRAIRAAGEGEIVRTLCERLVRMAELGITTVEVKSGYGLDLENETKQLRAIRAVAQQTSVPRVIPTYLGLHALPPEAKASRDEYIARVVSDDLAAIAREGLAQFCDAYIDRNAFSVAEADRFFARATSLGLGIRAHVGQFADVGGAELAARFGAASVDHMEHVSRTGLEALARANVRVGLLPIASFTLAQAPPALAELKAHGIRCFVASDANPGTAPTLSLPLALAFAVRMYGLSAQDAILGATREAAISLGLSDTGTLAVGQRADLVLWDLPHEAVLLQPWGSSLAKRVYRDGVLIFERQ